MDDIIRTDIAGARRAHASLLRTIIGLTNDEVRQPSRLPSWWVAHVLAHLAGNADGLTLVFAAAARGGVGDQYPGGATQRNADIETGAARPAEAIIADVTRSCAALEEAWATTTADVWRDGLGNTGFASGWPVGDLPFRRWREVEVHHADLGLAYGFADWPGDYVTEELDRQLTALPARLPPGASLRLVARDTGESWMVPAGSTTDGPVVTADRRRLVAWLLGRVEDPGYPPLSPWQAVASR
jgi:maleylpyruvate isomerase